jgi:hypothetical protein
MKLLLLLLLTALAAGLLVSCASDGPYHPASGPERIEFHDARLKIYPEDVRKDPALYDKLRVAWAGIIVTNQALDEETGGKFPINTVFESHYFDWMQHKHGWGVRLLISPRGEGLFRMRWSLNRKDPEATFEDALKYVAPGKLAIVYGTPESVDDDGTIVLRYHYLRIFDKAQFTADQLDYGRQGEEPIRPVHVSPNAATNAPSH